MVIKGTVHNGHIRIEENLLPEGTQVLITPINLPDVDALQQHDLTVLKSEIHRIASLPSEGDFNDGFTGADHDKILYGN